MAELLKWALFFLILLFILTFLVSCTVEHKLDPIKVEKIEVDHKVTPIIVKLPWGKDLFKADPDCDYVCLLYTSPSPRDRQKSRMPSSA